MVVVLVGLEIAWCSEWKWNEEKSTFIFLLTKKGVVEEIKDLRPISLSNTVFKAIQKC